MVKKTNEETRIKKFFKIYAILFSVLLLVNNSVIALEFKHEADKATWIKNFFKDKKAVSLNYSKKVTKEEIKFREQLLRAFETQNGIEHLEPIAVGKSINDTNIAKFNTACPDKKPINFYKCCYFYGHLGDTERVPEERLDNPALSDLTEEYKCSKNSNLKIYKFNVFNTPDNKQDYVLYCDDFVLLRFKGSIYDESREKNSNWIEGAYLQFDPKKCVYSDLVGPNMLYTQKKNFLTGIFKYKGKYYFYDIKTYILAGGKHEETSLGICGSDLIGGSYCFGKDYYNKNEI